MRRLEATVGITVAEMHDKEAAKAELDRALLPFRIAAAAWAGGVMLGPESCDDVAYANLLESIGETGDVPEQIDSASVCETIARGLGLDAVPAHREALYALVQSGQCVPALPYDLTFPEVFYPLGIPHVRRGFHSVLGNPPWEKVRVERRDVAAGLDPRFLLGREAAGVRDENQEIEKVFASSPVALAYQDAVESTKRACHELLLRPLKEIAPDLGTLTLDTYHAFLLKFLALLDANCNLGVLLGGGFAKSPTEAVLRRYLLAKAGVSLFAHFFNLRQLFAEASSRISFVTLVAKLGDKQEAILGGYDLTDADALPTGSQPGKLRELSKSDVERGGLSELGSDGEFAEPSRHSLASDSSTIVLRSLGITISEGLHRTGNKRYIEDLKQVLPEIEDAREPKAISLLVDSGFLCLYGGKSIDCFDPLPRQKSGKWSPQVDLVVSLNCPRLLSQATAIGLFRLVWRNTCGHIATNERSARACLYSASSYRSGLSDDRGSPAEQAQCGHRAICVCMSKLICVRS